MDSGRMDDPEADIRIAAFARLRALALIHGGALPWAALSCGVSFSREAASDQQFAPFVPERRYALRTVQQRLHQAAFRERVLDAYGRRCALSDLPEPRLID